MSGSKARSAMPVAGWAGLAAVVLAAGAGLLLAFYPVYQGASESASSSGVVASGSDSATLVQENGAWVILLLLVPLALALVGLVGAARRRKLVVWPPAAVLLGLVVLTGFSIGLFYVPAALALLLAAALTDPRAGRVGGSSGSERERLT